GLCVERRTISSPSQRRRTKGAHVTDFAAAGTRTLRMVVQISASAGLAGLWAQRLMHEMRRQPPRMTVPTTALLQQLQPLPMPMPLPLKHRREQPPQAWRRTLQAQAQELPL